MIVSHFHGNPTRLPFPWGIPFTRMLCDRAAGGGDIPVPSHIFVILLKCSSGSCDKQQYDTLAFVLPQIYPASECIVRTTVTLLLLSTKLSFNKVFMYTANSLVIITMYLVTVTKLFGYCNQIIWFYSTNKDLWLP